MQQETPREAEIEGWLTMLGIGSLCEWDVLHFLYRHQTSLLGAEYIARLVGHTVEPVIAALDILESMGLVERSRVSQNVRLYQFVLPEGSRGEGLTRLLEVADQRSGRLLVSKHLQGNDDCPQEGLEASRRFVGNAPKVVRALNEGPGQCPERRRPWRKAI